MKAIVQDRYGSADVLELREVAAPAFGDDEVLVRVRAAGCGPDVWHMTTGEPYFMRGVPQFRKLWRAPRGRDVSGVVEAVGANVSDLHPGDEVMGIVEGSFAELAVGKPDLLVRKPASIGFEQAAAVPISGLTALSALRGVAHVRSGQTVLIVGASGGVGTLATQIAKADGAHVTAVCSGAKADLVRSLGADDVIDYTREDFTTGRRRWDVIVDCAGRRPVHQLRRALTPKGTLAIVGGDGGGKWTGGFGRQILRAPILSLFVGQRLLPVSPKERGESLEILRRLIEDGALTPVVDRTFDLTDAPDALRYLEEGHPRGKVVVRV